MKNLLISALALFAGPAAAAAGVPQPPVLTAPALWPGAPVQVRADTAPVRVMELKGYISSWTQDCSGTACQLPKPGERNRPVTLKLAMPSAPGEASAAAASEKLALPGGVELAADMNFYAICPYGGTGSCEGRYFQAQVSFSGAAGAFCAAALNAADFAPFPVLVCAGALPDGRRFGVTLHRQPL